MMCPTPHPRCWQKAISSQLATRLALALLLVSTSWANSRAADNEPELTTPAALVQAEEPAVDPPALSDPPAAGSRDLWAISSRKAGYHHGSEGAPNLACWHFDPAQHRWTASTIEAFLASDDATVPTTIFVHGNRISHSQAFYVGWQAYRHLDKQVTPEQSYRFVIWSWPSTQVQGLLLQGVLRDVRSKAYQSDVHAWYLGWLLDRINPQVPVGLVGYSFGARLITGALHLAGGGQLIGRVLGERQNPDRLPMRAVLLAGGLDSYSLAPRGRNALALSRVDHMLVMVNPADSTLRYYRFLYGLHSGAQAVGYVGASGLHQWGEARNKVTHWNVTRYVGSEHEWARYLYSPTVMQGVRNFAVYGG